MKIKLVSGVLIKDSQVLLGLRKNTEFYPDYWAFPCGRVEHGESFVDALRRELFEEIGLQTLEVSNITTLYDQEMQIIHEVFMVEDWRGEAVNCEPDKCSALEWFDLNELPQPLTPAAQKIITSLAN